MIQKTKNKFTLVELLVVIAIISILAGMLLPALENAIGSARSIACINLEKQIGSFIGFYVEDSDEYFPYYTSAGWYTTMNWGGYEEFDPDSSNQDADGFVKLLVCPENSLPRSYHRSQYGLNYSGSKGVTYDRDIATHHPARLADFKTPTQTFMLADSNSYNYHNYDPTKSNGFLDTWGDIYELHNGGVNVTYVAGNAGNVKDILDINAGETEKFPFWYRKSYADF
ncbi:MAG: type II secretion system protein [Planctomycetota bacterium]|jgi:prepilin-type N-terminal cleavage/methylation domain-containing protein